MSETDDTDELLLIPPDFFLSNSALNNLDPYYGVVDSLITQVNHLEDRINFIQSSSDISVSFISDSSEMHSPSRRRFDDAAKMCSTSSQSTPQKPRSKFTMNSLPNSPDVARLKKSPQKAKRSEVNPMMGEIDSFLSNVKFIKRLNAVRNLESDFDVLDEIGSASKNLDINQVNEMLKEVELQDKKTEKDVERPFIKEKLWQAGDNVGSVPDYGFGMRKNMYLESKQNYETCNDRNDLDSSNSESTQTTAFEKYKYKAKGDKCKFDGEGSYNLGLVSLSKLWNSGEVRELPSKFQQKLQEERLRRQNFRSMCKDRCRAKTKHCEQAIQELQNRILELQERIAVAIQVDEAKDKAILRFHDSWEKAGIKLQDIEKQKERLEDEIDKLRKKLSDDSDETNQKISHYEKEASLALNIAHSSQDKLATLEKRCQQLEAELRTAEINSGEFQKKYLEEAEKNRQYPEILAQKDLELNDCKTVLAEARKEVAQSKRAVEICQSELVTMKNENDKLQFRLEEEKDNTKKVTEQKSKLLEEVSAHKSIARGLQDELTKTREQMESNKMDLKNFYQGQVELVVQSKLKEFQNQLDEAEKALKAELSKKELSIAKTAASHIQQISEKHSLEIKLLEEKHQEECRLYQLQVSQLRHEIDDCNLKIRRQHDRHVHIERQLHRFMESLRQDHVTTLDEMNSFRSKSFNNLEEILSLSVAEEERNRKAELDDSDAHARIGETPLTTRERGSKRKETSLQETIQMLLDKKAQGEEAQQQAMREMQYYKATKDMKGKPPWK